MLSGIRKGKKKKDHAVQVQVQVEDEVEDETTTTPLHHDNNPVHDNNPIAPPAVNKNQSIADQLRQSLESGDTSVLSKPNTSTDTTTTSDGGLPSSSSSSWNNNHLERRGRILQCEPRRNTNADNEQPLLVVGTSFAKSTKREQDMSVRELAAQEKATGINDNGNDNSMSWDEQMTRNLVRVGKKRRRKIGKDDDSDDEVERMQRLLPTTKEDLKPKAVAAAAAKMQQREQHRAVAQHHAQEKVTSKCSWWLESSNFSKHRLLALGNHVSLVMAPPTVSLIQGNHFYLVPLKHAESFVTCDDDNVWDEVRRFQTALKNMYAKRGKDIIMVETVLPNTGFWQTKLEIVPAPFHVVQDAPIYFKSAMVEQTEEWGTHNKVLSTTFQKPLKSVLPKHFPYFHVEWGNVATSSSTGFAQIIESSDFRHDFGLDTLAGMMDLEPIRMQRKQKFSYDEEKRGIADFLAKWKEFDWTLKLDE
jgi:hypothetical protein